MKKTSILLILVALQILFVLNPVKADAAIISGRVTAAEGGAGIAGVEVRAYASDSDFPALADDTTDSNGDYELNGLDAGNYKVRFWAGNTGYIHEWYNDKADFESADPLAVTEPGPTNINAVLGLSGSISGRVTSDGVTGIEGISVRVHGSTTGYFGDDITDSNGEYTVSGLPGPYHKVELYDLDGDYATEWYEDKTNYLTATLVPVTVPNTTAGIDAVLELSGSISGQVTDGIEGIAGIDVRVYDSINRRLVSVSTDSNGDYEVTRLPWGDLKVEFYDSSTRYISEWYNDKASFTSADPVTMTAPAHISNINAELQALGDELTVDFGVSGLYSYDGGWARLTTGNAQWLAAYGGKLAVDFGVSGFYEYSGGAWTRLTTGNADNNGNTMAAYAGGLAVDFGASGLYFYNGARWARLTTGNAQWLAAYGDKLAVDFGASGLYEYNGSAWTRLTPGNADNSGNTMAAYAGGLAVDFGASGLYFYNGTRWTKISSANVDWLTSYGDMLAADFGVYGLWKYNGAWTKITTSNPDNSGNTMAAYAGGLAVDFGASGLYFHNGAGWTRLSSGNPQWLRAYGGKLAVDFGASGMWEYDGFGWTRITTGDADNSGNTIIDW